MSLLLETYYFYLKAYLNEILHFLDKNHNISINMSTLLRKLKSHGLQRRYQVLLPSQLLELA